jgi:hydroxypyruvate isomerase
MLVSALWPKSQANISLMFGEVTFGRRPAAAAAAGFEAIECWWPFTTATPASTEIEAFVATVADAGLQLRGLNFFAGDMAGGNSTTASPLRLTSAADWVSPVSTRSTATVWPG